MYQKHAPKLTGMLIDALLKLQNDELIKEAISSKHIIDELVSNFLFLNRTNFAFRFKIKASYDKLTHG